MSQLARTPCYRQAWGANCSTAGRLPHVAMLSPARRCVRALSIDRKQSAPKFLRRVPDRLLHHAQQTHLRDVRQQRVALVSNCIHRIRMVATVGDTGD